MAARDLPAMLTHELMVTGASHISYIGHSQGTTIGMAFLSSHAGSALADHIKVGGKVLANSVTLFCKQHLCPEVICSISPCTSSSSTNARA